MSEEDLENFKGRLEYYGGKVFWGRLDYFRGNRITSKGVGVFYRVGQNISQVSENEAEMVCGLGGFPESPL